MDTIEALTQAPDADALLDVLLAMTDEIWLDEPRDLAQLRGGIVDSGAGAYGQVLNVLLFAQSEVRGLAYNACTHLLALAQDETVEVAVLHKVAHAFFPGRAGFLNYIGLHDFGSAFQAYLRIVDSVTDRAQFVELTRALRTYGIRMHMWTEHVYPWNLGADLLATTAETHAWTGEALAHGPWTPVAY